jgi:hypothetical protein
MRIFSAVRHSKDPKQFYGDLWSGNFLPALRELDCEVVESQVDLLPASRFMDIPGGFTKEELQIRSALTQAILQEVRDCLRSGPVDLFLSYFYNCHFDPSGFDELRKLGIPSVNFYCNSIHQFELVDSIASKADFSWHPEKAAQTAYKRAGANPVWVQMGADPHIYRPIPSTELQPDACFVGQRYADRDRWLAALVRAGLPLAVYGKGWGEPEEASESHAPERDGHPGRVTPKPGSLSSYVAAARQFVREQGVIAGLVRIAKAARIRAESAENIKTLKPHARGRAESVAVTLASHAVCLNFSNVWADGRPGSSLVPHVRLRDFEGPMCRTCYLTGHTDEITEFYEVGREIDTYTSEAELVDKVKYYLKHPETAERMREAGWRRARRDHTWTRRFEELFRKVGLYRST